MILQRSAAVELRMLWLVTVLMLVLSLGAQTGNAADVTAGRAAFNKCRICHTLEAGGRTAAGPNLHGIFGRKAGAIEGFAYSAAMKNSEVVWDNDTLAKYLHKPKAAIPGTRMAFPGIPSDKELADLLAYLREATK